MPLAEAKALLVREAGKELQPRRPATADQRREGLAANDTPARNRSDQPAFFHLFQHVPQDDLAALRLLAGELDSFSPSVGIQSGTSEPDCLFLDVTGLASLFGSEEKLVRAVVEYCRDRGYLVRAGIAHTIGLAQGLAQHVADRRSEFVILPAEECRRAFSPESGSPICLGLPIEALRLEPSITGILHQLGIFRIEQLLQVPREELFARFGNRIHQRLDQITGAVNEPLDTCPRPREFYAEQLLDHPTNHRETIEVIIERLVGKICRELRSSQQGALQWTIRLYGQEKLPLKLQVRLFAPTADPEQVNQLARMQLEQVLMPRLAKQKRRVNAASEDEQQRKRLERKGRWLQLDGRRLEIVEISVTVTASVVMENRQQRLFEDNPRTNKQALAHLINRLSGRLGHRNVVVPSLVSGNQPEYAYQLKPLVHTTGKQFRETVRPAAGSQVLSRPVRLFHPPQPIEVVTLSAARSQRGRQNNTGSLEPAPPRSDWATTIGTNPPALISLTAGRHKVTRHWGPERIETGWWRGSMTRRDYWKVEIGTGQQFWIFRDLRTDRWFLHGEF